MVEENGAASGEELPLEDVGQKLRRAREEKGLDLEQVAGETRISLRHLELIERGEFAELPARTYAIGFTRTYARVLGLDDEPLLDQLRAELSDGTERRANYTPSFEPGDPAKSPPPGVIWASVLAAIVLAAGAYAFYASRFAPGADPALDLPDSAPAAQQAGSAQPAEAGGQDAGAAQLATSASDEVAFTALEDGVWVSFYEAGGRRLEQKLMAAGERFVVPADARDPRIWTGRPDAFAITVGGQPVPKLAEDERVLRDIPITAEALRARASVADADGLPDENGTPASPEPAG